jgi:hypothetical protein
MRRFLIPGAMALLGLAAMTTTGPVIDMNARGEPLYPPRLPEVKTVRTRQQIERERRGWDKKRDPAKRHRRA